MMANNLQRDVWLTIATLGVKKFLGEKISVQITKTDRYPLSGAVPKSKSRFRFCLLPF